jgi:hypothetical protein
VLAEGGGVKLGAHPDWGGGKRDPWLGVCFVQSMENIIKLFQIVTPAAPHPLKQEICPATTLVDDAVLRREQRERQRGEGPQREERLEDLRGQKFENFENALSLGVYEEIAHQLPCAFVKLQAKYPAL